MKVLLMHEMSGVHSELKKGLMDIGIETNIASFGDGWKKFNTDISLGNPEGPFRGALSKTALQTSLVKQLKKYDVVQTISPRLFYRPINDILMNFLPTSETKYFYLAAGSDVIYRKHVRKLPYYPPHDWFESPREYKNLKNLLKLVKGVIPVCYEYEYCMRKEGVVPHEIIPFPVDVSAHKATLLAKNKKLKIFHPLNRRSDFKGTNTIRAVFQQLQERYANVADFIIAGRMPHGEYHKLTDEVDIIVDQINSMSYGMSAAYGLAKGKVVISGLEEMTKHIEHYRDCPIVNASPDANELYYKIESLILDRSKVREIGEHSRYFAEKYHDHRRVAEIFASAYEK